MKKRMLLTAVMALPLMMWAQDDDMYFVPTKENVEKEARTYGMPRNTYYSGSQRSVDDYNRRAWSSVTPIDSAGNDVIDFSAVRGVYSDSTYATDSDSDYRYMRRMSRFDDYTPSQAYWDGYRDGAWSSPWYYTRYYTWYDPWYWDDPWFYGYHGYYGYYGYYSPWRYSYYRPWGYYGWYRPHYRYVGTVYQPHVVRVNPHANGSRTFSNGNSARFSHGTFGGRGLSDSQFGGGTRSTHSGSFGSFGGSLNSGGSSFGGGSRGGGGGRFGR